MPGEYICPDCFGRHFYEGQTTIYGREFVCGNIYCRNIFVESSTGISKGQFRATERFDSFDLKQQYSPMGQAL